MDFYINSLDLFIKIYVVLIGLVIGSFLNVLIYRIPINIPVSKGSSFCPKCNHKLNWLDLFPVLSYVFLGGKCRYCKDKISPRYPLIEMLNAVCYYLVYIKYGFSFLSLIYFVVCSCLITLALIDFDHTIIPDRFNIIIGVCALIVLLISRDVSWLDKVIGLFAISVPIYIIAAITGGIGAGDVKLFAVCGFLLGWKLILLTLLIASVTAAVYGLVLILMKKAKGETKIPFGPFIALATVVSILFGNNIIDFYFSLFKF